MAIISGLRQRRLIKVFIASPGDLKPERQSAREVVDEINSTLGRTFDVDIDLLGWEDTLPGVGRPQAIINRDVDDCDLFIGLLWKRWGTPSGEEFSSGFEEEFERARQRNQSTGQPEIWLAFKEVEPSQLADPGDQLKRVLAFKQAQIAARIVLYKEFKDERDWATQLRCWLMTHLGRLVKDEMEVLRQSPRAESSMPTEVVVSAPPVSIGVGSSPASAADSASSAIPPQLREVGEKFFRAVTSNSQSAFSEIMSSLDQFQTARMFLTAKAWLSRITHELLSTHEIHLLYTGREQLSFIVPEYEIVIRTIIGDRFSTTTGWYWFSDFELPGLTDFLYSRAMHDPLADVRARVIDLLNEAMVYPAEGEVLGFAESILNDADGDVQKAALEYLANSGNPVLLTLLREKSMHSGPAGRSAHMAALRLKSFVDPVATFTEISSASDTVNAEILRLLEECAPRVPSAILITAMDSADRGIRWLAARELLGRSELRTDRATLLLTDDSLRVRQIALESLIQQGSQLSPAAITEYLKPTPPAEGQQAGLAGFGALSGMEFVDPKKVIEALFEAYPEDKLKQEISWYNLNGVAAYRVLARKYFTTNRDRIRHDLATHFQDLRQESIDHLKTDLRTQHGLTVDQESQASLALDRLLAERDAEVDNYITARYTAAALAGIALHDDSVNVSLIREFLETRGLADPQGEVRLQALKCLRRFGSATDATLAVQVAKASYAEVREEALKTAIALAPGAMGAATELVNSDEVDFVRAGVGAIWNEEPDIVKGVLFPLLQHSKTEVRQLATAYFILRYPKERLQGILQEYMGLPTYYYNVVCWLDRALYCPAGLAYGYRKRFRKEIGGLDSWCSLQEE